MRVGIPVWNDHVSPVMDAAERLLVVEIEGGRALRREIRRLDPGSLAGTAAAVRSADVDVLICGAVSSELARALGAGGARVVPWVTGAADEVVSAFVEDALGDARFTLPGCGRGPGGGRRRRRRGGPGRRAR
jgi:predicted Fe-Mo cluster-binding NifX family protein